MPLAAVRLPTDSPCLVGSEEAPPMTKVLLVGLVVEIVVLAWLVVLMVRA